MRLLGNYGAPSHVVLGPMIDRRTVTCVSPTERNQWLQLLRRESKYGAKQSPKPQRLQVGRTTSVLALLSCVLIFIYCLLFFRSQRANRACANSTNHLPSRRTCPCNLQLPNMSGHSPASDPHLRFGTLVTSRPLVFF